MLIRLFIEVIKVFTQVRRTIASQQYSRFGRQQGDIDLLTLTVAETVTHTNNCMQQR